MPVYLAHGFRWPRDGLTGIRVHAIMHNLEDCSAEYVQNENSTTAILSSFRDIYPTLMQQLEEPKTGRSLKLLEQYDPEDELSDDAASQQYAYVVDRVITIAAGGGSLSLAAPERTAEHRRQKSQSSHTTSHNRPKTASPPRITNFGKPPSFSSSNSSLLPQHNIAALSINVEDAMSSGPAVTPQAWEALAELRDKIAEGEKIGWWVIYNGDPERSTGEDERDGESGSDYDDEEEDEEEEEEARTPTQSDPPVECGLLGQPLPTLLPPGMKRTIVEESVPVEKVPIATAMPHPPPPPLEERVQPPENKTTTRTKSSRSFSMPLRKKLSRANLPVPKNDDVPEPPKLKEITKREGLRHKFFGRSEKKG